MKTLKVAERDVVGQPWVRAVYVNRYTVVGIESPPEA